MDQLLRVLLAFTVAYLVCLIAPREAFSQTVAPAGRTIYALPTPAGVIPTEVLGNYSPLAQRALPTVVTSSGVAASSSATVPVAVAGRTVSVPVTATAQVSRLAIARAAAKLVPIVSTALAVKELYDLLKSAGYQQAPDGRLQTTEQLGVPSDPAGTGYYYSPSLAASLIGKSPQEACEKLGRAWLDGTGNSNVFNLDAQVDDQFRCTIKVPWKVCTGSCEPQTVYYKVAPGKLPNFYVPQLITPDDSRMANDAANYMASNPARQQRLYDALQSDWQANPNLPAAANPIDASTPITMSAPPVTTPETVVKVETRQLPNGSVDTITTKEKTTVTPTTTGSTVGDIKTSYTYNITTTEETTNNVTNTTTTNTINQKGEVAAPEKPQDPCQSDPDRLSCKDLDTPPAAEAIQKIEVPFSFSPLNFSSAAGCPTPITVYAYGARQISFQPMCDLMTQLRPLFLACASLATALIFLQGIRQL